MWREGQTASTRDERAPRGREAAIPWYLERFYSWAYLTPQAINRFERPWLINLIVWGNYRRLGAVTLSRLGGASAGRVLQVGCAYGDFSLRLAALARERGGRLAVVDVAPIQLQNLAAKLAPSPDLALHRMDSAALGFERGAFDAVVLFLLLHEQPDAWRLRTLAEAWRVTRPGGRLVIVDYARPAWWHPARWLLPPALSWLEPFALALWRQPIDDFLPETARRAKVERTTLFGGLYQIVVVDKS